MAMIRQGYNNCFYDIIRKVNFAPVNPATTHVLHFFQVLMLIVRF